jgi:hypothetical protein
MDRQGGHMQKGVPQIDGGTEWACLACGFGFKITKSHKYRMAENILRMESKARVGGPSENVTPENLDAFVAFLEEG